MSSTIRVVSHEDHAGVLTYAEGLSAVRDGYRDRAEGEEFVNVPRKRLVDRDREMHVVGQFGISPRAGYGGVLLHAHGGTPNVRDDGGSDTDEADGTGGGATYSYLVYDLGTGSLAGVLAGPLDGAEYEVGASLAFGTALESAVGTDLLARDDATSLGIVGTGRNARSHLVAFDHVRDWADVTVHSPTRESRRSFVAEMGDVVDSPVGAADVVDAVVEGADVVLCATSAEEPVFDGTLLTPGQHVTSIVGGDAKKIRAGLASRRRREIDDATVELADVYAANSAETARTDEQGDFYHPVRNGIIDWADVVDLPDVVGGRHPGRTAADQITLYKQNAIQSATHMAVAGAVWERVEAEDRGTAVPL